MQQTNAFSTIYFLPVSEGFKLENLPALAESVKGKGSCRISTDYKLIYLDASELSFFDKIMNFFRNLFSNQKAGDVFDTIQRDVKATLINHVITHLVKNQKKVVENQKKITIHRNLVHKVLNQTKIALVSLDNNPNLKVDLEHGIVYTCLEDLGQIQVRKTVEKNTFDNIEEMIEELKYKKVLCENLLTPPQIDGLEELKHDLLAGITDLMQNIINRKPYRSVEDLVSEKNYIERCCREEGFHLDIALTKNQVLKESWYSVAISEKDLPYFVE